MGGTAKRNARTTKETTDSTKRSSRYGGSTYKSESRYGTRDTQWTTIVSQKLPKKLSDEIITAAKNMFFQLDRDNSGSIDAEELGLMLRSLGQNPTDEELNELIRSVDGADGGPADGQIQLREFLRLYGDAFGGDDDLKLRKVDKSDVFNIFESFGGNVGDAGSKVAGADMMERIESEFGLSVSLNDVFGMDCSQLAKEDVAKMLDIELPTK